MINQPTDLLLSELQVWKYANTVETFSRGEVIQATKLNPRTVDHTLRKLIDMHKIVRFGQGRATRYRVLHSGKGYGE